MQSDALRLTPRELLQLDYSTCFYSFFRDVWPVLAPGSPLVENWHLQCIAEYLEAVSLGQITRLLINVPPRSSKSTLCTITWPVWHWLQKPSTKFMFASYSQSLSTKHSLDRRTLITSDFFRSLFADAFTLRSDQDQKTKFENTARGSMFATSMLGSYTGEGADVLVIDDPHSPKMAESEALREATLEAFDVGLSTRLNDKKTGAIVVVMQRLHELDLTGHITKSENHGWQHLVFPAISERKTLVQMPIDGALVSRDVGDILHPARESKRTLDAQALVMGQYGFAGQYQQSPAPADGGILKRKFWKRYRELPNFSRTIISADLRFKDDKNSGDFVVFAVLGKVGPDIYLIDVRRGRWSYVETKNELLKLCAKYPDARGKYIENKANGPALIDDMKRVVSGLVPVEPEGSKIERAHAVTPLHEAGNLYLPESAEWLADFERECELFPNAAHDDQVDAYTQGVLQLRDSALEYLKAMATY